MTSLKTSLFLHFLFKFSSILYKSTKHKLTYHENSANRYVIRFAQSQKWEACWTHSVQKNSRKKFREINVQYDSFDVNKLVSQNFRQNIVRVKFCNFHTVCVPFRIASRRKLCQHGPLDFLSPTQIMITHQKNVVPCLGKK